MWVLILAAIIYTGLLIWLMAPRRKGPVPKKMQFTCANKCTDKLLIDEGTGYAKKLDCQKKCEVTDGFRLTAGGICKSTSADDSCTLSEDNCFLTQYGCYADSVNYPEGNWKCDLRDGCMKAECSTDADKTCFESHEKCDAQCKSQCTGDPSLNCLYTTECADATNCFDDVDDCYKRCRKLTCGQPPGAGDDVRPMCMTSLCDEGDQACQDMKPDRHLKNCLKSCGLFKCDPYQGGCRQLNEKQRETCDPNTDSTCFVGLEECEKSGCKDVPVKCTVNGCFQGTGCDPSADDDCYPNMGSCQNDCTPQGYGCQDKCAAPLDCTYPDIYNKCWPDSASCQTSCDGHKMWLLYQGNCIEPPTGACEVSDPNCFMYEPQCKNAL